MQEPDIRADTRGWLNACLGLACRPLSDSDLAAYIDISVSEAGQGLNRSLFAAFDGLYEQISIDLGRRALGYVQREEL